jgi:hypothetical protein
MRFLLVLSATCSLGCIPIQMTRIAQVETYRQRYEFCGDKNLSARAMDLFLGSKEWAALEKKGDSKSQATDKSRADYYASTLTDQFDVIGQLAFFMSLYPTDRDEFFIEGYGKHIVFSKTSANLGIIMTADFFIVDDGPILIESLRKSKSVVVKVRQQITREFLLSEDNSANSESDKSREFQGRGVKIAEVYIRIYLKELEDYVFVIDYDREHDVGIPKIGAPTLELETIGFLRFDAHRDGRKLLDLRERNSWLVKGGYPELVDKNRLPVSGGRPTSYEDAWKPTTLCGKK